VELALSGLMGAFEEIQVCFSGSRTSRRWNTGTGREARKEIAVEILQQGIQTRPIVAAGRDLKDMLASGDWSILGRLARADQRSGLV
jgi:hypothetical protein